MTSQHSFYLSTPAYQKGWLTKESGSWIGHFNRRTVDAATSMIRQRPAFVIGRTVNVRGIGLQRSRQEFLLLTDAEQQCGAEYYFGRQLLTVRIDSDGYRRVRIPLLWFVRIGVPLAAILISAGFFFSVLPPTALQRAGTFP